MRFLAGDGPANWPPPPPPSRNEPDSATVFCTHDDGDAMETGAAAAAATCVAPSAKFINIQSATASWKEKEDGRRATWTQTTTTTGPVRGTDCTAAVLARVTVAQRTHIFSTYASVRPSSFHSARESSPRPREGRTANGDMLIEQPNDREGDSNKSPQCRFSLSFMRDVEDLFMSLVCRSPLSRFHHLNDAEIERRSRR